MERVEEGEIQWDCSVVLCFHNYSRQLVEVQADKNESKGESEENGRIRSLPPR